MSTPTTDTDAIALLNSLASDVDTEINAVSSAHSAHETQSLVTATTLRDAAQAGNPIIHESSS